MYRSLIATLTLAGVPAAAQDAAYDGLWRANPTVDCSVSGVDGGALRIEDGVLHGVENTCEMTDPVDVRDMDATLFDMVCEGAGDGAAFTDRAFFSKAADGGLILVWNGFALKYESCEDSLPGTVTTAEDLGVTVPATTDGD